MIRIGHVILRKRTERNMTQQQLAEFLNVTKATISKWEKGVSYPDITLLPILGSFFRVSVDELLDAKLMMTKEEIRKWYARYAERFSKETFEVVNQDVQEMIKLYYDDDNFLLQMSILLLNHAEFSPDATEVFEFVLETLTRVEEITGDVWIRRQANAMIAMNALYLTRPELALERLEGSIQPNLGEEMILAQAHEALGQSEDAKRTLQVMVYQQLIAMIGSSAFYLKLTLDEEVQFQETIQRMSGLIELFNVDKLHPNVSLQFYFAVSQYAAVKEDEELCEKYLTRFVDVISTDLFSFKLKGDAYFDLLEQWLDTLDLGTAPPREETIIRESIGQTFKHPAFELYKDKDWFKDLEGKIQFRMGDSYE